MHTYDTVFSYLSPQWEKYIEHTRRHIHTHTDTHTHTHTWKSGLKQLVRELYSCQATGFLFSHTRSSKLFDIRPDCQCQWQYMWGGEWYVGLWQEQHAEGIIADRLITYHHSLSSYDKAHTLWKPYIYSLTEMYSCSNNKLVTPFEWPGIPNHFLPQ